MKTKKLIVLVLAMALVASISVTATLAYLTDTESANNTFTVGKVGISLDEAKTDEYGKVIEGAERVKENTYKAMPGHEYAKDPTVTVDADSEESFIRMFVTINHMDIFRDAFDVEGETAAVPFEKMFTKTASWAAGAITVKDNAATYEFRYSDKVSTVDQEAKELPALFETFTLPGNLTNKQIETLGTEETQLKINVIAQAIQADGFETADLAWAAYDKQNTQQDSVTIK